MIPSRDPRGSSEVLAAELAAPARRAGRTTGMAATGLFAALFAACAFPTISSGTVALGQLSASQARQIVQHPTGGVVAAILVAEGDRVSEGDVLVRLAGVEEGASAGILTARTLALRAEEAVRSAEAKGQTSARFPAELRAAAAADPGAQAVLNAQTAAFAARNAELAALQSQIEANRAQISAEIAGAGARRDAAHRQLELLAQEIGAMRTLFEKGLAPLPRLRALERAEADLTGSAAALEAEIRRLRAEDRQLAARAREANLLARSEAAEALRGVQAELAETGPRVTAAEDALARIEVRAPATGSIVSLHVKTVGGVVRPGEPILELTPLTDRLVVDARIRPQDADDVREGAEATIRFDLLNISNTPRVSGRVLRISPDALEDPRTGAFYFQAKVEIPKEEAAKLPAQALAPGLPAEVLIHSGSRTILSYLFAPIERVAFRALREN